MKRIIKKIPCWIFGCYNHWPPFEVGDEQHCERCDKYYIPQYLKRISKKP